jgi:HSP20 family protein
MSLMRWTPASFLSDSPLRSFFREMEREMRELTADVPSFRTPALDVLENNERYEVQVELAGINPENVDVQLHNGVLTIHAEKKSVEPAEGNRYTHRERFVGTYKASLHIPDTVDSDAASARFEHGVLYLTLPKKPQAQPQRIPVQVNKS